MLALLVFDLMPFDHGDKIPLGVTSQRGLTEMRVGRNEIVGINIEIGEIAATPTGHEYFLANLI